MQDEEVKIVKNVNFKMLSVELKKVDVYACVCVCVVKSHCQLYKL